MLSSNSLVAGVHPGLQLWECGPTLLEWVVHAQWRELIACMSNCWRECGHYDPAYKYISAYGTSTSLVSPNSAAGERREGAAAVHGPWDPWKWGLNAVASPFPCCWFQRVGEEGKEKKIAAGSARLWAEQPMTSQHMWSSQQALCWHASELESSLHMQHSDSTSSGSAPIKCLGALTWEAGGQGSRHPLLRVGLNWHFPDLLEEGSNW